MALEEGRVEETIVDQVPHLDLARDEAEAQDREIQARVPADGGIATSAEKA